MKLSLQKLTEYGFNRHAMTEANFYRICEQEGIEVIECFQSNTFYMVIEGKPFIVIGTRKRGLKKLYAMFHELAHHFLHAGRLLNEAFFYGQIENKQEFEADAFATIALIPINKVDDYDFLEEHPNKFARRIFNDRKKIKFLYGI